MPSFASEFGSWVDDAQLYALDAQLSSIMTAIPFLGKALVSSFMLWLKLPWFFANVVRAASFVVGSLRNGVDELLSSPCASCPLCKHAATLCQSTTGIFANRFDSQGRHIANGCYHGGAVHHRSCLYVLHDGNDDCCHSDFPSRSITASAARHVWFYNPSHGHLWSSDCNSHHIRHSRHEGGQGLAHTHQPPIHYPRTLIDILAVDTRIAEMAFGTRQPRGCL